jgi:hypothetical protein
VLQDNGNRRHYGSVPPRRRKLFIVACAAVGIAVLVSGFVINGVTHSPVRWGWLLVAAGLVMAIYAFYLWIRLSD